MKKNGILFSVVLLVLAGMVMTGCPKVDNSTTGGDEDETIPFIAKAEGDPTTKIVFTFNEDVTDLDLEDIIITKKDGEATKGALTETDDEKVWELTITVIKAGEISVKIDKEGIATGSKSVKVTKAPPPVDPPDPGEAGNLGVATYNKGTGDEDGKESQATWMVDGEMYDLMAAPGTKLVVTFENAIAGAIQLIWQDTTNWGWNQNNILTDNGGAKPELGTSVSEDKKTITIDLSLAFKDYDTPNSGFLDKTGTAKAVKLVLAYYSGTNKMRVLNVQKADLVAGDVVPTVTDVTVTPATITVAKGGTQSFAATVTGAHDPAQTITWSITTTDIDTETNISTEGLLTVAAAETKTQLTVKATSTVDTTKFGEATVTVSAEVPTVTSVTVTPATASVLKGETQQFTATVEGTNSPATTVTWSIVTTDVDTGTTIDTTGKLTVAVAETKTTITIKATSTQDTTQYGEAEVTVEAVVLSAGIFELGLPDSNGWWYTNGRDGKTSDLTVETLKAAKYLIIKAVSLPSNNGFGTIQPALQTSADSDAWHDQAISEGWNQPKATDDQWDIDYNDEDIFYIVIDLTQLSFWSGFVSGSVADEKAKIKLNNPPAQIKIANAYLAASTVTLVKPTTAFDLNASFGWAAQTVPELTPPTP